MYDSVGRILGPGDGKVLTWQLLAEVVGVARAVLWGVENAVEMVEEVLPVGSARTSVDCGGATVARGLDMRLLRAPFP